MGEFGDMHLKVSEPGTEVDRGGAERTRPLEAEVSEDMLAVFGMAEEIGVAPPCGEMWEFMAGFLAEMRIEDHYMSPRFGKLWERFHTHAAALYATDAKTLPLSARMCSEVLARAVSRISEAEYAAMWGNAPYVFVSLESAGLLCLLSEGCVAAAAGGSKPDSRFASAVADALAGREEQIWYLWKKDLAVSVFG